MAESNKIQLFEDKRIRTAWDEENQELYFSIADVIGVLTDQPTKRGAAKYWSVVKVRLKNEGCELPTICSQLKMTAEDGKKRLTDIKKVNNPLRSRRGGACNLAPFREGGF